MKEEFSQIALDIVGDNYVSRVKRLWVGDHYVYVQSPEDNIVVNLNACVYWNSDLDHEKAAVMAAQWNMLDWSYLEEKRKNNGTIEKLINIKERVKREMDKMQDNT